MVATIQIDNMPNQLVPGQQYTLKASWANLPWALVITVRICTYETGLLGYKSGWIDLGGGSFDIPVTIPVNVSPPSGSLTILVEMSQADNDTTCGHNIYISNYYVVPLVKWKCISPGTCELATDGTFVSRSECEAACTSDPNKWKCVDRNTNTCTQGGGTFNDEASCKASCKPTTTTDCKGIKIGSSCVPTIYVIGGAAVFMMMFMMMSKR